MTLEEARNRLAEQEAARLRRASPEDFSGFTTHSGVYMQYPGAYNDYIDSVVGEFEASERSEFDYLHGREDQ